MKALEGLVEMWVNQHPEIDRIVLFGSYARGDYFPGSDVDVLIIMTESDKPARDRIAAFRPTSFPCDIDIFPYTKNEVERLMKDPHGLVYRALSEGQQLYP
jgi:predicted nucleotidyltransferase